MSKTITIYEPKYVTQLEDDCHAMRQCLTSIRYINNGPDQGSASWRAETAASLAENTLLAIENSRAGKLNPPPPVLQGVRDGVFIEEARRILNAIDNALTRDTMINTTFKLDERINILIQKYLKFKEDNKALRDELAETNEELAETNEVLARYESVFQDINSLVQKATE